MNRRTLILGIILTLLCDIVGLICLIVNPNTFTIVMFLVIVALTVFQAIAVWLLARKQNNKQ